MTRLWLLPNPYTLSFHIGWDGKMVTATFPAVPDCEPGKGKTEAEAILALAKNIQKALENYLKPK